jgi:hypothetical protein
MRRSKIVIVVAGFAGLLVAGLAWADVPPPEAEACKGKQVGDACDVLGTSLKGLCVQSTCTKVTPPPLPDSGGPVKYPCVLCQLPPDGGVKPLADLGPKPVDKVDAGTKPAADGAAPAKDSGVARPVEKDSGCAVGGLSVTRVLGPWFLAAAVSAMLLLLGRRRRR